MILNGKTLDQVLPLRDLYTQYHDHKRLTVFANKGRVCVRCGREGVLLLRMVGKAGDVHIDLYTDDFILMTVDHITPRTLCRKLGWSKEETEALSNKQPMCDPCNNKKSDRLEVQTIQTPPKIAATTILRQLVNNSNVFDRSLA